MWHLPITASQERPMLCETESHVILTSIRLMWYPLTKWWPLSNAGGNDAQKFYNPYRSMDILLMKYQYSVGH